jgi:hypothetical protein
MLLTAQIWDAQKQELAGRVGATLRRIASKVAEVLQAGKTAKIVPNAERLRRIDSGCTPLGKKCPILREPFAFVENHLLLAALLAALLGLRDWRDQFSATARFQNAVGRSTVLQLPVTRRVAIGRVKNGAFKELLSCHAGPRLPDG